MYICYTRSELSYKNGTYSVLVFYNGLSYSTLHYIARIISYGSSPCWTYPLYGSSHTFFVLVYPNRLKCSDRFVFPKLLCRLAERLQISNLWWSSLRSCPSQLHASLSILPAFMLWSASSMAQDVQILLFEFTRM